MPNTTYGTPYVASSDLVSAYPGVSSTLATRVDNISLIGNGVNAQTASYTLVLADGGKTITMTNAGATTLTVPTNASVAFPTGVGIVAMNLGAGTMTVAGAGGVTVNGASLAVAQYEAITLRKTASDTWIAVKGGGLPKATVSATTGSPTITSVTQNGTAYTVYGWTGSGSITFSQPGVIDAFVQAGGGGAGNRSGAGAGGAFIGKIAVATGTTYTVTVGGGGGRTTNGSNSSIGSLVTVLGGGYGSDVSSAGGSGGSGGGGDATAGTGTGWQGTNGSGQTGGGGGGGYSTPASGGAGGAGGTIRWETATNTVTARYFGGGGSGQGGSPAGGFGGGGAGSGTAAAGGNGVANTGGGGGGSYSGTPGNGGSGFFMIRVEN